MVDDIFTIGDYREIIDDSPQVHYIVYSYLVVVASCACTRGNFVHFPSVSSSAVSMKNTRSRVLGV